MRLSSSLWAACLLLTGCGDESALNSASFPGPTAAPPCPPGILRVTDLAQLTDADRNNGSVRPDLGVLPPPRSFDGDPLVPGAFTVLQQRFSDIPRPAGDQGMSKGTVYAPSSDGLGTASGRFPLVVVMPGFGITHAAYAAYSSLFASHGFVVLGLDTTDGGFTPTSDHAREARRASASIDWILSASDYASHVDPTKIATAGHSKGGKVAFWTAAIDPRIDLVIGWDPSNSGGAPCAIDPLGCNSQPAAPNCNTPEGLGEGILQNMRAESFVIGVLPDGFNPDPAHNALNFYRGAPGPSTYLFLRGGHADFATGNPQLQALSRRASAGELLAVLQNRRLDPDFLPGGSRFDPDGLVNPPVRRK